jgi:hypothetical protein
MKEAAQKSDYDSEDDEPVQKPTKQTSITVNLGSLGNPIFMAQLADVTNTRALLASKVKRIPKKRRRRTGNGDDMQSVFSVATTVNQN